MHLNRRRHRIGKSLYIRSAALLLCGMMSCALFSAQAAAGESVPVGPAVRSGGETVALDTAPAYDGATVIVIRTKRQPEVPAVPMPKALKATLKASVALSEEQRERYEISLLAKLLWGEARGIDSEMQKAAVAWCALNRVSSDRFDGTTVEEVLTDEAQFGGYSPDNPVQSNLESLAKDVYHRWKREQAGTKHVGRVLGAEYYYFWGDGKRNYFVDDAEKIGSKSVWKWPSTASNPYPDIREARMRKYKPTKEELHMIAQVIWHKARNLKSKREQAAVVWCIFNRVESGLYPDTVEEVLEQSGQFSKYDPDLEIDKKYYELAKDVADRWQEEMNGDGTIDVGRVLPADYLYFKGNGKKNIFFKSRKNRAAWKWTLKNPYDS